MHSRIISSSLLVLFVILLQNCETKIEEEVNYIARVNDNFLTESEVDMQLDSLKFDKKFKEEFIREWIEREVLYNLAVEEGVLNSEEYNEVRQSSEKELAISFFLERLSSVSLHVVTDDELRNFYETSVELSTLQNDLYIINTINFYNPYAAEKFRKILINSGLHWKSTIVDFDSSAIADYALKGQYYEYQLEPKYISRRLKRLSKNEVSSVFEKEPNVFSVVQLVDMFGKGSLIPFEYVRNDIKSLYSAYKRKAMLTTLLDSVYKGFEIEIKLEL